MFWKIAICPSSPDGGGLTLVNVGPAIAGTEVTANSSTDDVAHAKVIGRMGTLLQMSGPTPPGNQERPIENPRWPRFGARQQPHEGRTNGINVPTGPNKALAIARRVGR